MIPRFGEPPQANRAYTRRPGAYAILLQGREMLITHQDEPEPEFQLPGGGIDPGESPVAALHREVYEETGWTMTAPRRVGAFRYFTYMPEYDLWAEKICTIFVARPALRKGPALEPGHTPLWLPIEEAVPLIANPGDRHYSGLFV